MLVIQLVKLYFYQRLSDDGNGFWIGGNSRIQLPYWAERANMRNLVMGEIFLLIARIYAGSRHASLHSQSNDPSFSNILHTLLQCPDVLGKSLNILRTATSQGGAEREGLDREIRQLYPVAFTQFSCLLIEVILFSRNS